jgi:hypothetical protein
MSTTNQSVRAAIKKTTETVVCRVYLASSQLNLTGDAWNKVNLDTVDYDTGNNFDLVNYKFVAPVTGLYSIKACISATNVVITKRYLLAVYKNGVAMFFGSLGVVDSNVYPFNAMDEIFLQKDDYLELYFYPNVGAGTNTTAVYGGKPYTYITIRLITKEGIRQ